MNDQQLKGLVGTEVRGMDWDHPVATNPPAFTASERFLTRLARRSFLGLWSYPHVYRDQGIGGRQREGKEVVDLLVVFDHHVILFSDKSCAFPNTGNLDQDWARWYRRAIEASAKQLWGAERWLRTHPDRAFLDKQCSVPLPVPLPPLQAAHFHRIVVASDESGLRGARTGGSGKLYIRPDIVGRAHTRRTTDGGMPFAIGQIDPARGFVHVLDETSLGIVLSTLDTIADFVMYLERKEALISSGKLLAAAGEEDLLGLYLRDVDKDGMHDFVLKTDWEKVVVPEGHWEHYVDSPERAAKEEADRISYQWDAIIEKFTFHAIAGGLRHQADTVPTLNEQERAYRLLAREPRTRRRLLAGALIEKLAATPRDRLGFRVILPSYPGDPHYVFVLAHESIGSTLPEYWERRRAILAGYCKVAKLRFPVATCIVGLATEAGLDVQKRSEDLVVLDCSRWTAEDEAEARDIQDVTDWLRAPEMTHTVEAEYPVGPRKRVKPQRNALCPCKSGLKFKKCCGRVM